MWSDRLGLPCSSDPLACGGGERCDHEGGQYLGHRWAGCPVLEAVREPHVAMVLGLERDSALNPISGWPDAQAAWVGDLWSTLRALKSDREVGEISGKGGV